MKWIDHAHAQAYTQRHPACWPQLPVHVSHVNAARRPGEALALERSCSDYGPVLTSLCLSHTHIKRRMSVGARYGGHGGR